MTLSNRKLHRSSEHVYYEILMFLGSIKLLMYSSQINSDQFIRNILLEVFAIHLRTLLDFFYTTKRINPDDIIAIDYIRNFKSFYKARTPFYKLSTTRKRVHKQIAHLSYHRNRYNKRTKPWQFKRISDLIFPTIDAFYNNLPKHRQKWQYFVDLKKIIDHYKP